MPSIVMRRMGRIGLAVAAVVAAAPAFSADLAYPYPLEDPAPSCVYREERIEEGLPPHPPRAEAPLTAPVSSPDRVSLRLRRTDAARS